ncbi:MAG: hypothetical protein SLRJCFUN_001767 [Candidatus Fervidibacter sp.]
MWGSHQLVGKPEVAVVVWQTRLLQRSFIADHQTVAKSLRVMEMPITNWEELKRIVEGKRNAPLVAGINVSVTSAIRLGAVEAVDAKRFPLAQIKARPDACPFCRAMHDKVLRVDEHSAYLPPFHINCRCVVVRLSEGVAPVDFNTEDEEIQRNLRHAHFVADLVKGREVRYEALKIPARVEGRDFIFRRVKDPTTGRWVSKLEYRPGEARMVQFIGLENLMPSKGERAIFDLQRIGRAIRQLRQAYPELFVRADIRRVYVIEAARGQKWHWRGMVNPYSGTILLNPAKIEKGMPSVGVIDPTEQFLLTLVEELMHPKVQLSVERHPERFRQYDDQIWQRGHHILRPLFRKGENERFSWRRNTQEWLTKALTFYLAGQKGQLLDLPFSLGRLWEEVK